MTALAAHREVKTRNRHTMKTGSSLVETSAVVYVGSLLVADATTGLAKVAADLGAGGSVFLGICTGFKYLTTTLGASVTGDGTIVAEYAYGHQVLVPCVAGLTVADKMRACYCLDDEGVTDVSTAGPGCGIFVENESASTGWVELGTYALPAAT